MGKTRSNDVIKPQDLEVKNLIADELNVANIHNDETIVINSPDTNIYGDGVYINGDEVYIGGHQIFLGDYLDIVTMECGLRIVNVNSLSDHVRTRPLAIGTMIYSVENSKPLWLAEEGEKSLTSIIISSVSGVSGNVSVELESETITFTLTEGDTVADVVQNMTTAINAGTYYTAKVVGNSVALESKDYITETSTPTLTCDEGVVVSAQIIVGRSGRPYIFVDGAGTELEVE